jgi:hypothetical protein
MVSRTDRGDHLVMDVGALGFLNGGHAHADALSLTLSVAGVPLLIDPGTGCYTVDPVIRDRFRLTAYHNTVVVDHRPQSQPRGAFHWSSAAHASLDAWRSNEAFDFIEGSHRGYAPLTHTRQVLCRPGCWIVVDWLRGAPVPHAAAHWHLDPQWTTTLAAPHMVRVDHPCGARVWFLTVNARFQVFRGATDAEALGWCAPVYGPLVPTTTLRLERPAGWPSPLVTLIVESEAAPTIDMLAAHGEVAALGGTAFSWCGTGGAETVMAAEPGSGPRLRRAGAVETDARFLALRHGDAGSRAGVWLVDGTGAHRDGWLGVAAPGMMPDLHVSFESGRPCLVSSRPAQGTSVTGAALTGAGGYSRIAEG